MDDLPQAPDNQETTAELLEAEPPRLLFNRARDAFLALLDADHEPNEALKAAAAEYRKGWHDGEVYHFRTPARTSEADDAQR